VEETMRRCATYLRVSTDQQNFINQQPDIDRYVQFKNLTVVQTYVDEGVSGRKTSRPALTRMLVDARAGRFDILVVAKLDRLGRSAKHLLTILDELDGLGIAFASATQDIDTGSASGRLLYTVLGAVAEFESTLISERTLAGLRIARSRGARLGRPRLALDSEIAQVSALPAGEAARRTGLSIPTIRRYRARLRRAS
jgi:DNA invertase Pin-like site-specific DNA recombinase